MTIAHVGKLSRETGGEYRVRRSLQCTESSVAALIKSANKCGHGPVKHQSPNRQLLYLKLLTSVPLRWSKGKTYYFIRLLKIHI